MRQLFHPTWEVHVALADGRGTVAERRAYAVHVLACAQCRATAASVSSMLHDVARLAPVVTPLNAWHVISARLDAGERVLLAPSTVPPTTGAQIPRTYAWRVLLAFVSAAAITLILFWASTRAMYAASSELRVYPRAGTRAVELRYTNPMGCRACTALVVRARWLSADDDRVSDEIPIVAAGTLPRTGDTFAGTIQVPVEAVVGFVALESPDAVWTDDNEGRAWVVEPAHDAEGRLIAERAIILDLGGRDWEGALKRSRALVVAYPDSVLPWTHLIDRERRLTHDERTIARDRATLARLDAHARTVTDSSGEVAARMFRLAWSVFNVAVTGDTSTLPMPMRYWLGRLHDSRIASSRAKQVRLLIELQEMYARPESALVRLEQRWHEDSSDYSLVSEGIRTSRRASDTTAAIRWWRRLGQTRPSTRRTVAVRLAQLAPSRTEGIGMLRSYIASGGDDDAWRALGESRTAFHRGQEARVARANMALSSALFANGDSAEAERALANAAHGSWSTPALEALATRTLAHGDTARALQSLAMLSADPSRSPAFADTMRARTGRFYTSGAVRVWRDSGAVLLREHLLEGVHRVALAGALTGVTSEGDTVVSVTGRREPLLLSFWSAGCAPSIDELPDLAAVLPAMTARGMSALVVSRAKRSAKRRGEAALASMPFVVDAGGALHRTVRQWMTPERFLVLPGMSRRAWRVSLPVSELPLLAAALQAGILSASTLP